MLKLYDLTIEYKQDPMGIDEVQPRFSWKLDSDGQNVVQTARQITVKTGDQMIWNSNRAQTEQSILTEYLGPNLLPRTTYEWTVTVWDNRGESATATARFETGLLGGTAFEGKAAWITHNLPDGETACPVYTKTFRVTDTATSDDRGWSRRCTGPSCRGRDGRSGPGWCPGSGGAPGQPCTSR